MVQIHKGEYENVFDGLLQEIDQDLAGVVSAQLGSWGIVTVSFTKNQSVIGLRLWSLDNTYLGIHRFKAIDVCAGDSIQFNWTPKAV